MSGVRSGAGRVLIVTRCRDAGPGPQPGRHPVPVPPPPDPTPRVLHLRDAFLVQMDELDRLLEFKLRRMLDPVVASPAPERRRVRQRGVSILTIAPLSVELAPATIAVVEPTMAILPDRPVPPLS
jgi:hypothetical protein